MPKDPVELSAEVRRELEEILEPLRKARIERIASILNKDEKWVQTVLCSSNQLKTIFSNEEVQRLAMIEDRHWYVCFRICLLLGEHDRALAIQCPGVNLGAMLFDFIERAKEVKKKAEELLH